MNTNTLWKRIREVAQNPLPEVQRWKEQTGGKVIGCLSCMPYFVPEEILHAAGALPVGVWGAEIPISLADAKLQTFACTMVRSSIEMGLKGMLNVCDAMVFSSTCDAFQNLSEIWTRCTLTPSIGIDVVMPRQVDRPSASEYFEEVLKRFLVQVEALTGRTVPNDALCRSIKVYNEERRLLKVLDDLRAEDPDVFSARDMMDLVLSSSFLPKQEHASLLYKITDALKGRAKERKKAGSQVRIFLAGVMPRPVEVLDVLERAGARVVGDRMGMGSLYYSLEIPEEKDPLKALAAGYLAYPPCSTIYKHGFSRAEDLIDQVKRTRADGVMLLGMKFCEPEFFDYPDLKDRLEKAGIPALVFETELGMSAIAPVRTRIEAFLETLRANMEERG